MLFFKGAHNFIGHLVLYGLDLHYCCGLHGHSELRSSVTVSVKSVT